MCHRLRVNGLEAIHERPAVQVAVEGRGVHGGGEKETSRMDAHGPVQLCGPGTLRQGKYNVQASSDWVPSTLCTCS